MLPDSRTAAGSAGLRALVEQPARALLTLDYDGTLAPIAERPEDAVPAPGALAALTRCARTFGTVAIVTGRPATVVVALCGAAAVDGLVVLGHYGEERWTAAAGLVAPPEPTGLSAARRELPDLVAAVAGAVVEEKGLSLAVHTRTAADPEAALAAVTPLVARLAAATGLAVNHGRYVVELRAPHARDKGDAVAGLVAERDPYALLFAGDDLVDVPAYDALDEFRTAGGAGVGIFVDNPEAAAVRDRADVVVPDTAACVALLAGLADAAAR